MRLISKKKDGFLFAYSQHIPGNLSGLVLMLFLLSASTLTAQSFTNLPRLLPSYSKDILADGVQFGIDCVEDVFLDSKGRLLFQACGQTQDFLHFEQLLYDGYELRPLIIHRQEELREYSFFAKGINARDQIFGIYEAQTGKGLGTFLLNPASGQYELFPFHFDDPSLHAVKAVDMIANSDSSYWILLLFGKASANSAIYRLFEGEFEELITLTPEDTQLLPEAKGRVQRLFHEFSHDIWFTNGVYSLASYNKRRGELTTYDQSQFSRLPDYGKDAGIPTPHPRNLNVGADGTYYLYDHHEFYIWNQQQDRFQSISEQFPSGWTGTGLFGDRVGNSCFVFLDEKKEYKALLLDTEGKWYDCSAFLQNVVPGDLADLVGEDFTKEIYVCGQATLRHMEVQQSRAIRHLMPGLFFSSVLELPDGSFLINTVNNGWFEWRSGWRQARLFSGNLACVSELSTRMVQQIIQDEKGRYWFTLSNQVYVVDPNRNSCQIYEATNPRSEGEGYLLALLGNQQVATISYGLNFFDLETEEAFLPGGNIPEKLPASARDMHVSRDGILWVLTDDGLWKIDLEKKEAKELGDEVGFENTSFVSIYEDELGMLWLGTQFGGLYQFDPQQERVLQVITTEQGLSHNLVYALLADKEGDIWAATGQGITLLSAEGKVLANFYEQDGLNENVFTRFDGFKSLDESKLFFGNKSGLNVLDPQAIKTSILREGQNPHIYLTNLAYVDADSGEEQHLGIQEDEQLAIVLPAESRNLRLSYSLSTYLETDKNQFAYRLLGRTDTFWIDLGAQHELNLLDLPSGRYLLQIKGRDYRNRQSLNNLEINLQIQEYFYKTTWFYLLCTLPFLLFAAAWIYRIRREKSVLEATVVARTQQIREDKALIEQQAEELRELDQAKTRFFTNISHEFRTPLTVIGGMNSQLRDYPEKWLQRGTDTIGRNVQKLLRMVNQILDLRKLESGKLQLELIQDDIIPFLRYLANSFESLAETKEINLQYVSRLETLQMDFDPEKLSMVLTNLLSNALKFTHTGGKIEVEVRQGAGNQLLLSVTDTGIGIPEAQLPKVFDRFFQADLTPDGAQNTPVQTGQGTGIGLSLTKELITLMGGKIQAESTPGEGTTFSISLPIQQTAPIQTAAAIPGELLPAMTESNPRPASSNGAQSNTDLPSLLIIEDNPDIIEYLHACLEDHYVLYSAEDGQAGIEAAIDQVPDLIITDVMMPRKNGYEVAETLKLDERTSHIPIVMLTAKADQSSKVEGYKRGADAYLAKPFDREELLIRLEKLLLLRKTLQARYQTSTEPPITADPVVQVEDAFIQKARQQIMEHIQDHSYRGEALGKDLAMGRSNLHRKIKALTGMSVSHFIRQVRIEASQKLLLDLNLQIAEISYLVGFKEPGYYNRVFQEVCEMTPGEWREKRIS